MKGGEIVIYLINPLEFKDTKCEWPWPCPGEIVCGDWCKID